MLLEADTLFNVIAAGVIGESVMRQGNTRRAKFADIALANLTGRFDKRHPAGSEG